MGLSVIDWPPLFGPSPELPGTERLGEKHIGVASATFIPWHPTPAVLDAWEKTTVDSGPSLETQTNPLPLGRTSRILTSPLWGEISIPRASASASTGRLLHDSGPRGHTSLWETTVSPWTTGGSGAPVYTEGATSDPPDGSNTRLLTYCLIVLGHGDRWDLWESSSELCTLFQTIYVPWGMPVLPQTSHKAAVHDRTPTRKGWVCRNDFSATWHSQYWTHRIPVQKANRYYTAAMSPSSLWNCFTVIACPSFILETIVRMDSIQLGDNCARIVIESHTTPGTWFSGRATTPSFSYWVSTPSSECGQGRHLAVELPSPETGPV